MGQYNTKWPISLVYTLKPADKCNKSHFSSFSVYFRWHSGDGSSVWHLFAVWYFVFVKVFVIWRILYLAFVWQLCLNSIAVLLSIVVAFKSQQESRNSTKASLKPFVSWPCKLPQPVEGFDNASVPEYIRLIMSISCVNYVHGSDTSTHQQIEANSAKTPLNKKSRATAVKTMCFVMRQFPNSFQANCEILKVHLILYHTSNEFFLQNSKCNTVEGGQLTFLPWP